MDTFRLSLHKEISPKSFHRYMRHSVLGFIIDLKNIQAISKHKPQDC